VLPNVPPEPEVPKEEVDGPKTELVEVLLVFVDEVDDAVELVEVLFVFVDEVDDAVELVSVELG
jgi:hypothetical protein